MTRYKLLLGVTYSTLEDEIDRMVSDDTSAKLLNAFFAQGTGFIGVMEYDRAEETGGQTRQKTKAAELHHKANPKKPSS
jgi:hypothetical protein